MPASIVAIADAVTAELNGNSFSQPFTAQRLYLPVFDLQGMSQLKVTVVPKGIISASLDRSRDSLDYQIDVAVQKKTPNEIEAIDLLRYRASLGLVAPAWKTCRSMLPTICTNYVNSPAS